MIGQPINNGIRQPHAAICSAGIREFNATPSSDANMTATCWLADRQEQRYSPIRIDFPSIAV
jgi:hypothetical protein